MNLSEWMRRYAKAPLVRLLSLAFLVQALYFAYLAYSRYGQQLERIEVLRQSVSLGVQQANRPAMESAMLSMLTDPEVSAVVLCGPAGTDMSYPPSAKGLCETRSGNFGDWRLRATLIGPEGFYLLVVLRALTVFSPLFFLVSISLALVLTILFLLLRVRARFETEILGPLSEGLAASAPLGINELEELRRKNLERITLIGEKARADALVEISAQVAHDIRSPLAALGAAAKGLSASAEQRQLIEGAVGRMQGIADDLLKRYRSPGTAEQSAAKPVAMQLAGIVEQVVEEKRLQHAGKAGVKINFESEGGELKAAVDAKELQRAISNLVNNAVEAFEKGGTVLVKVASLDGRVLISVKDDGKGIPAGILSKLGAKGETHGKAGGTGLGLYHAKTSAKSWGGGLKIESEPGKGTVVTMDLPRAGASDSAHKAVVLLDDDMLVHMNWRMAAKAAGAELKAFKTPEELESVQGDLPKNIPIYIDAELGDGVKGEEVAQRLRERGFTDITMATGHAPDKFAGLSWLKVRGKEPPWGQS